MQGNLQTVKAAAVQDLARRIAFQAPALADLTPEQLEQVARAVVLGKLTEDLKKQATLARIDYPAERKTFLDQAGKVKSPHTARAYASALDRLEAWGNKAGVSILEMKAREADDFAYSLQTEGRAAASIRRDLAAASSFFTFLERRYDEIRNPFRGSKARPEKRAKKETEVPTAGELKKILGTLDPALKAAALCMAARGLRVGALPSLTIREGRFTARSKGKDISGELPREVLEALEAAGLDSRRPFACYSETKIADRFRYYAGKAGFPFSVHDLRHYYAVKEYQKDRDLYRLKTLLGHASVQVTENYLKSLKLA